MALLLAGCATTAPPPAPPPPAVEPAPPPLAEARESRLLAKAAADAGDGTTAQLHLLDARKSADLLLAASPRDTEVLRESGRIHRDSFRFAEAARDFRAALENSPGRDGETVYDLAYCLAYGGAFAEALPLFEESGALLGPQSRIAVNAAICEERVGRRDQGVARLARFYDAECAAGRADGADARLALEKTWDLTVQKRAFEEGVAAFRSLAQAHPDRPEPPFMLGNLLAFLGRHGEAAEAYADLPLPAALARRARSLSLLGGARRAETDAAVRAALAGAVDQPETAEAAVRVVRLHLEAGEPGTARSLAVAAAEVLEESADVALAEGDAHLAEGKPDLAKAAFERARELSPYSGEPPARAARSALAAARTGVGRDLSFPDVPGTPLDPVRPAETLLDFEDAALFLRPLAGVRFTDGAARFRGPRVFLHFFPDLDGRRWTHVDLRLRAEGGPATVRVSLSDGYDQMSDAPPGYLLWPTVPTVGPEWTAVSVPLAGFSPDPAVRTSPTDLARVKCLGLEFAAAGGKGVPTPWIDAVALRDERSGAVRVLERFDDPLAETGVLFDGSTAPFTRVIPTPDAVADLLPTGTGPVSKAILEDQNGTFHPSMVGAGQGALRLRHGEVGYFPSKANPAGRGFQDGPGAGVVRLNPDRDLTSFGALTFLARGENGGEKVRVRLLDAHFTTVAAPRSVFPRTAARDGAVVLGKEWRMYRIPLDAYPEIDRAAMAEFRFEVGSEVGNAPGATIYLDEIGLE
jgi:tetratricopeptide (TPR) repeat protein